MEDQAAEPQSQDTSTPAAEQTIEQRFESAAQRAQEQILAENDQQQGQAPMPPPPPEGLTIDGKTYTADEVRELQRGYMMQRDYTRKTQGLAELRQAVENERAQVMEAAQLLQQQWINQQRGAQQPAEAQDEDPYLSEMKKRLDPVQQELVQLRQTQAELQQYIHDQKQAAEETKLATELEKMKEKYPLLSEETVFSWMMHEGIDMESAARASHGLNEKRFGPRPNNQPAGGRPPVAGPQTRRISAQAPGQTPGMPLRKIVNWDDAEKSANAFLDETQRMG